MHGVLIFTTLPCLVRLPLGADPPGLCQLYWSDIFPLYSSLFNAISFGVLCMSLDGYEPYEWDDR